MLLLSRSWTLLCKEFNLSGSRQRRKASWKNSYTTPTSFMGCVFKHLGHLPYLVPRKLPTNLTQVLVYREIKPTYFCDCCSFLLSKSCWFMVTALSTFLVWAINWFRAFLFSFAESSTLLTWSYEKENQSYGSIFRQNIDLVTLYYKIVIWY